MSHINSNFTLIQSYPVFEPNQVLTDVQLNGIVRYLEQQERLTRFYTAGMGIICGLQAQWEATGLHITEGCGLTSEGYLIKSPEWLLTHYREKAIPPQWFGLDREKFPGLFEGIYELEPAPDVDDNELIGLQKTHVAGRVLVLVLECFEDSKDELCNNDCDERGIELNFILHKLLLPLDTANTILNACYDHDKYVPSLFASMEELFYYKYFISYPHIERFGYKSDENGTSARLNTIINYNEFQNRYNEILSPLADRLDQALQNVHKIFSPVFAPGEVKVSPLQLDPGLKDLIKKGLFHRFEVQYLYDYLKDLVRAYLEFVENAFDLMADCPADMRRFPRHLFLHHFDDNAYPDASLSTIYRTPYTQPPIYNSNPIRLDEVKTLFTRLGILAQSYQSPDLFGFGDTRITPSKMDNQPLSETAMPFYYHSSVANWWNPRRRRTGRMNQVYSYHRPSMPPYNDPLVFRMEGSDFLRIEGHVGKPFQEVLGELTDFQQKYNLPFQVVALKIAEEFKDELFQFECNDLDNIDEDDVRKRHLFHHFAEVYPGMEHGAGVPFGGTFILVYVEPDDVTEEINRLKSQINNSKERLLRLNLAGQSRLVVGDFYLPYACVSCCPPICYMVERPTPVLIISPIVFCSGDTTTHILDVLAYPGGGIISGPGYEFRNGQHLFTPSNSGIIYPGSGTVTLRYLVDGAEAVVQLTIVAPPISGFNLLVNNQAVTEICVNQGPVDIKLDDGAHTGVFTADAGGIEQNQSIDGFIFFPELLTVELPATVIITHSVSEDENLCPGIFTRSIRVNPLPDPNFKMTIKEGEEIDKEVCQDVNEVLLTPHATEGNSLFQAFIKDDNGNLVEVPGAIVNGNILLIRVFDRMFRKASQVNLLIRHTKTTLFGCQDRLGRDLTIYKVPSAPAFELPKTICKEATPVELPEIPLGTYYYRLSDTDSWTKMPDPNNRFDPQIIGDVDLPAEVSIRCMVTNGPCSAFSERKALVIAPPEPFFAGPEFLIGNQEVIHLEITSIAPTDGNDYVWTSVPPQMDGEFPSKPPLPDVVHLFYNPRQVIENNGVLVTLTVQRNGCSGTFSRLFPLQENEDITVADVQPGNSEESIELLRRRDDRIRAELNELSSDTALAATIEFKATGKLVNFRGGSEKLNVVFTETMNNLMKSAAKVKKGSPRQTKLLQLMTIATESYMDKQVMASPGELGTVAQDTLTKLLPDMIKAGLDVKALKTNWKGNELKKTLSAPAADAFNKLLK
jgi:hypothetical protein